MSRHSKNNTASSVFTYHERKQMKDSGSIHERLEEDCFRSFEDCFICVFRATEPIASPQGYLFCRKCLIAAFAQQKLNWEKSMQERLMRDAARQDIDKINKIREFQAVSEALTTTVPIPVAQKSSTKKQAGISSVLDHSDEERETELSYRKQLELQKPGRKKMRSDMSSVSFWAPHDEKNILSAATQEPKTRQTKLEKFKTLCPVTKQRLKLSECIPINPVVDGEDKAKRWLCSISSKVLGHNTVVLDISNGQLMLKELAESLGIMDLLEMKPGETSYAAHNVVNASLFRPSFG